MRAHTHAHNETLFMLSMGYALHCIVSHDLVRGLNVDIVVAVVGVVGTCMFGRRRFTHQPPVKLISCSLLLEVAHRRRPVFGFEFACP